MQAKGIPPKVVNDFLKTYGMGRVGKAKATMGYFKDYGLSDKALQTIGRGFNAETIEIIQNTYMRSKVFYSGTDTDLILILFKQAGSSEAASTLSNSLITLGNSGIVPSAFGEYGIISSISGMSPAVTALSTGITPALMKKLFGFGIRPTDYDGYGIVGADSAESVAEAIEHTKGFLNFFSKTDAETWAKNAFNSWKNALPADEVNAIWKYTGDECYENINAVLRGLEPAYEGNNARYVELLSQAINKTNLPENVVLYRGTTKAMLGDLKNLPVEQWVGKNISDKAFMSTSLLSEGAFNKELNLIIKAPKGSKGAFIGEMSQYPSEVEVLLNKGQQMIITDVLESSATKTTIVVELLP